MAEEELSDSFHNGSFPEGTMLGHYRLEWFVRRNSLGEMYSAVNTESNKSCSLTVIFPSVSKHAPEVAGQLLRKAQEACFFSHPNIIQIQETLSLSSCHCVVTEYFSGESADNLLLRGGLPENQVLNIAAQLASFLAEAEKLPGMVPDFTPDTLFIDSQGNVKIFYPGFKRYYHLLPGNAAGTEKSLSDFAAFTAPELLLGRGLPGIRSAIYSLGMLMYFLLCGKTPCDGENICQTMAAVLAAEEGGLVSAAPHVSFKTISLISSLTSWDPEKRPASAAALLKELGKKAPRKGIALPWLILGGAVMTGFVGTAGYFCCKKLFSPEENYFRNLERLGGRTPIVVRSSANKPSYPGYQKQSAADRAASQRVKNQRAYAAASQKKSSAASSASLERTRIAERIHMCRSRLQILENELKRGTPAPKLIPLQKERIEFRKEQITELEKYYRILKERSEGPQTKDPALNAKIRSDIILYLQRFEKVYLDTVEEHMEKLRKGTVSAFPIGVLQNSGVDFSMPIPVPQILLRDMDHHIREKKALPLGILLLRGVLVTVADGVNFLERVRAPLPALEQSMLQHWGILADAEVNKSALTYLACELVNGNKTCSPEYLGGSQYVNAFFMMKQMLLLSGGGTGWGLYYAAGDDKSSLETLRLFLQAEAPLDYDREGRTALFQAVIHGNKEKTALLLEAGANDKARDKHGKTAFDYEPYGQLLNGIKNNDTQAISAAIAAGADLKFVWQNNRTPLHEACIRGKKEAAVLLLDSGADPYFAPPYHLTPLKSCVWGEKESVAVVKIFLDRGIDPDKGAGGCFMKCLVDEGMVKSKNAPGIAALLLESGKCKVTPEQLFSVCRNGTTWELFRVLVEKGPDLNNPAYNGLMALALHNGCPLDILKLLYQRKAPAVTRRELDKRLNNVTPEEKQAFYDSVFKKKTQNNALQKLNESKAEKSEKQNKAPQTQSKSKVEKSKTQSNVSQKQRRAKKYSGGFGRRLVYYQWEDKLVELISSDKGKELKKFITERRIPPDSIVAGKTMLQLAASKDSPLVIAELLKINADPFKITPEEKRSAVLIAAKSGEFASFNLLAACVPPREMIHIQCAEAIFSLKNGDVFLKVYLENHGDAIKAMKISFLTLALRSRASERSVHQLINFYGSLDAPKHGAVIHQAAASLYRPGIITALLRHKASAQGRAGVWITERRTRESHYIKLTVPEIIRRMKMEREYNKLFRQGGVL